MNKKIIALCLAGILAVGVYARYTQLAWHFSNVDDLGVAEVILKNRQSGEHGLFPVPKLYTYAPFQFIFTPFLINEEQTYRQLLFWARLPSCIFGILGLLAMIIFYRLLDKERMEASLFGLAVLACSWENIIHAKQAHNYALGVMASILVFVLFIVNLRKYKDKSVSLGAMVLNGFFLAILSHMHYQVIVFAGCFFLTLFCFSFYRQSFWKNVLNFLVGGVVYLALIFPMWFFFLRKYLNEQAGAPEATLGPDNMFVLTFDATTGMWAKIAHAFQYYATNFFIVFQANTAFIPEEHVLFKPFSYVLYVISLLGLVGFIRTKDSRRKWVGIFCAVLSVFWMGLIFVHKLNLSPTRHSLILLPLMCIVMAEGLHYGLALLRHSNKCSRIKNWLSPVLAFVIVVLFLSKYDVFYQTRRDPFVESHIVNMLKKYDVEHVFTHIRSDGIMLMKGVAEHEAQAQAKVRREYKTLAWISRSDFHMPFERCEELRNAFNIQSVKEALARKKEPVVIARPCRDFKLVYSDVDRSEQQVDFSPKTISNIYTKGYYFYIVSVK